MSESQRQALLDAKKIMIMQAENPDGDSLGASLGLEDILCELGKEVSLYCSVEMPKYLRYIPGWDRVGIEPDLSSDLIIIVDTVSATLLSKALEVPGMRHHLEAHPVLVFDHHGEVASDLPFDHELVVDADAVATAEMIATIARENNWAMTPPGASALMSGILADSLGLTTTATTSRSIRTVADLVDAGAVPSNIEAGRRELMKKSADILQFKGELLGRIEYHLEGALALVPITWEDIQQYSDQYNPSVLVLDEMRLVNGVEIAIAIKTYPDGKLTGKIRSNLPIAEQVAGYFGGGGHAYSSGFRVYESYEKIVPELIAAVDKALRS